MIAAPEAAVIAEHTPLWNSVIDGLGNHDSGKKRVSEKRPQWDCLHSGNERDCPREILNINRSILF